MNGAAAIGMVINLVNGKANPINGDRTLVGQAWRQNGRHQYLQVPAFSYRRKLHHFAQAVHMATHQVAANAVAHAHGLF
jgi:hypothetical protein